MKLFDIYGKIDSKVLSDLVMKTLDHWLGPCPKTHKHDHKACPVTPDGPDDWLKVHRRMAGIHESCISADRDYIDTMIDAGRGELPNSFYEVWTEEMWWELIAARSAMAAIIAIHLRTTEKLDKPPTTADKYFDYINAKVREQYESAEEEMVAKEMREMLGLPRTVN